jgi:transposase-like protein
MTLRIKTMNDHVTISTFELFKLFPDKETARSYLESRLWPDGVKCPVCSAGKERITVRKDGYYRCNECQEDFTVRTGTIFERSHIPLHKWVYAMYLLVTARKGISSLQLSKEIGITQKSAWFMLHRLREACGGKDLKKLKGIIEVDETYVGGKEGNKHESQKLHMGRGAVGKEIVVGLRERNGNVIAKHVPEADAEHLQGAIYGNVEYGSLVHTDDAPVYADLGTLFFNHETVNHSVGEFVRDQVTVNGIESVWAVLKRGLTGVYHQVSPKHLSRYVDEFAFRLNDGNVKHLTLNRLDAMIRAATGKRLTYERLTQ